MYYGVVLVAVLLYTGNFLLDRQVVKRAGSGICTMAIAVGSGAVVGVPILLATNGFQLGYTPFTLWLAALSAADMLVCGFFGLKTAERANLSLYALFSQLGGMLLPSMAGVLFFGESLTVAKGICYLLMGGALGLGLQKSDPSTDKRGNSLFYIGVFFFNGMNGVISKVFTSSTLEKTTAADYTIYAALWSVVFAGLILLVQWMRGRFQGVPFAALGLAALNGGMNRLASWLYVIALVHIPASVQSPLVTGGVMILCSVFALFTHNKPKTKDWIGVLLSFIGLLALFLIPV